MQWQFDGGGWAVALPLQPNKPPDFFGPSRKMLSSPSGKRMRCKWITVLLGSWVLVLIWHLSHCCYLTVIKGPQPSGRRNPRQEHIQVCSVGDTLGWTGDWLCSEICRKQHQWVSLWGCGTDNVPNTQVLLVWIKTQCQQLAEMSIKCQEKKVNSHWVLQLGRPASQFPHKDVQVLWIFVRHRGGKRRKKEKAQGLCRSYWQWLQWW